MAGGVALGMTVDDKQVRALFARAPDMIQLRMKSLIEREAIGIQREMTMATPVGVHGGAGGLRGSVRYKLDLGGLRAEIKPTVPYADAVETGSKPHWVPLSAIQEGQPLGDWAKVKGINPQALRVSIGRKGTKAHPYIKPTYDKTKPIAQRNIAAGIAQFAQELNDGRI
jgi:hypothetical protein